MEPVLRTIGSVVMVKLDGALTANGEAEKLPEILWNLVRMKATRVVLDLRRVSHMDSSGMGLLVACHKTVGDLGGAVKLLGPNPRVESLLAVTHFLGLFQVFQTEDGALRSFEPDESPTARLGPPSIRTSPETGLHR